MRKTLPIRSEQSNSTNRNRHNAVSTKKAPIRELSTYIHYNRLTSLSTSSSVVAQEVAIRMTT